MTIEEILKKHDVHTRELELELFRHLNEAIAVRDNSLLADVFTLIDNIISKLSSERAYSGDEETRSTLSLQIDTINSIRAGISSLK